MEDYFYESLTDMCNDIALNSVAGSYWRMGKEMWRIKSCQEEIFLPPES